MLFIKSFMKVQILNNYLRDSLSILYYVLTSFNVKTEVVI